MSNSKIEFIRLKHFILNMRLNNKTNLYKPIQKCSDGNYLHSNYVYMRYIKNLTYNTLGNVNDAGIEEISDNESCGMSTIPCIKINRLNSIIKEDQSLLNDWKKEVESEINAKKADTKYQESIKTPNLSSTINNKYNRDYIPRFLETINEAINKYKNRKYTKDELNGLPPSDCMITFEKGKYEKQYEINVNRFVKGKNLQFREPDFGRAASAAPVMAAAVFLTSAANGSICLLTLSTSSSVCPMAAEADPKIGST